jgi:hypothetical protein
MRNSWEQEWNDREREGKKPNKTSRGKRIEEKAQGQDIYIYI